MGGIDVTQKEIRIGMVGVDTKADYAKVAHVSAINGFPGLKLAAVVTRNEQSAQEAAEAFGADRWFSDPITMIGDDQIVAYPSVGSHGMRTKNCRCGD
jgi:predicted dehydrogenase